MRFRQEYERLPTCLITCSLRHKCVCSGRGHPTGDTCGGVRIFDSGNLPAAEPERRQDDHVNGEQDEFRVPSHKKEEVEKKHDDDGCGMQNQVSHWLSSKIFWHDEQNLERRCMCNVALTLNKPFGGPAYLLP